MAGAKGFLDWIAPPEGVEALAASGELLDGVAEAPWTSDEDVERANETVARLEAGQPLTPHDDQVVEAIILPNERPVVDVVDGTYAAPPAPFAHLGEPAARAVIEPLFASVGRVELPNRPSIPYGGTGFMVGEDLLMTNRHVAELFAEGLGREQLSFIPGQSAAVDFLRERDRPATRQFEIERIAMVHPYWDMALLVVAGLEEIPALRLSVAPPGDLRDHEVVVIGYPALDPRNNVEVQNRVFGGIFNVKRLQPGLLRQLGDVVSFGHQVAAVTHDSSTLGGNSGSAVIHVATGEVVALHFAGRYLEANYAVPSHELAIDPLVVDAAVNFAGRVANGAPPWSDYWAEADPGSSTGAEGAGPHAITATLPLEITIRIRSAGDAPEVEVERVVEPFHETNYSNRRGYEEDFLGIPVPMPTVRRKSAMAKLADGSHELPYEHFSVVMNKARRLAQFAASNVDAAKEKKEPEPGRSYSRTGLGGLDPKRDKERWFTDPRIPAVDQLPDRFYMNDRQAFDRGHIVRREDVAWGETYDQVRRANGDTYHVTNCSPQVKGFNQSKEGGIWGLLENIVLDQAETERYNLFAGPVFHKDDPIFVGVDDEGAITVPIPRRFWKVVVARKEDELQSFAFILEQDLSATDFGDVEFAVDETWKERMISVADLDKLIQEISFPSLFKESDQIDADPGEAVRAAAGELETYSKS